MSAMRSLLVAISAVCACGMPTPGHAQSYPSQPVKLILPYTAGSPNDVLARLIAPQLSARLGQPVIIDNRPGGGTTTRRQRRDQRRTGWPYAVVLQQPHAPDRAGRQHDANLRCAEGFRADRNCGSGVERYRDRKRRAGKDGAGICRLRKSQSRQAQLRLRPGDPAAAGGRDVQVGGRDRDYQRALQRRQRRRCPTCWAGAFR